MRFYIHVIFPFFVMTLVYTLLTFFFGAKGIYTQKKLEEELKNVMQNINMINRKGEELDIIIKNLTSDARVKHILEKSQGIIKLASFTADPLRDASCGNAITIHEPTFISDSLCKRFAFLMGLISLIIEILILKSYDTAEEREKLYIYN